MLCPPSGSLAAHLIFCVLCLPLGCGLQLLKLPLANCQLRLAHRQLGCGGSCGGVYEPRCCCCQEEESRLQVRLAARIDPQALRCTSHPAICALRRSAPVTTSGCSCTAAVHCLHPCSAAACCSTCPRRPLPLRQDNIQRVACSFGMQRPYQALQPAVPLQAARCDGSLHNGIQRVSAGLRCAAIRPWLDAERGLQVWDLSSPVACDGCGCRAAGRRRWRRRRLAMAARGRSSELFSPELCRYGPLRNFCIHWANRAGLKASGQRGCPGP